MSTTKAYPGRDVPQHLVRAIQVVLQAQGAAQHMTHHAVRTLYRSFIDQGISRPPMHNQAYATSRDLPGTGGAGGPADSKLATDSNKEKATYS
jgi:hypothetical protein